jgi:hypothetical protein
MFKALFFWLAMGVQLCMAQKVCVGISLGTIDNPKVDLAVNPSAELYLFKNWSLLTEFSIPVLTFQDNHSISDRSFFKFKEELRFHVFSSKKYVSQYWGIQFTSANRQFIAKNGFYFDQTLPFGSNVYKYDTASISSNLQSLSAQYGLIIKISQHWYIDNFLGVGVRTNHTIYNQVLNAKLLDSREALQYTGALSSIYGWRYKGDITRPHFDAGVRILYKF